MTWASLVAQRVKHLPAAWETSVRSLGQEDPVEKEMATHSSILAWRLPDTTEQLTHLGKLLSFSKIQLFGSIMIVSSGCHKDEVTWLL